MPEVAGLPRQIWPAYSGLSQVFPALRRAQLLFLQEFLVRRDADEVDVGAGPEAVRILVLGRDGGGLGRLVGLQQAVGLERQHRRQADAVQDARLRRTPLGTNAIDRLARRQAAGTSS